MLPLWPTSWKIYEPALSETGSVAHMQAYRPTIPSAGCMRLQIHGCNPPSAHAGIKSAMFHLAAQGWQGILPVSDLALTSSLTQNKLCTNTRPLYGGRQKVPCSKCVIRSPVDRTALFLDQLQGLVGSTASAWHVCSRLPMPVPLRLAGNAPTNRCISWSYKTF